MRAISERLHGTTLHRYPLAWLAAAWCAGILLANRFPEDSHRFNLAWAAIGCLALAALLRRTLWLRSIFLALGLMLVGTLYANVRSFGESDSLSNVAERSPKPIALRGVITSTASWRPSSTSFFDHREPSESNQPSDRSPHGPWLTQWTAHWSHVRTRGEWLPIQSRSSLVVLGRISDFLPGDEVEVFGKFHRIEPPSNPGMRDFAEYSRREGKFVVVSVDDSDQVIKLRTSWRHLPNRLRAKAVRFVDATLYRRVSHDQSPLAAALVFGQQEQIDWYAKQQFMATGTIHMLSISGLHVELVGGVLLLACLILNLRPKPMLVTILTILFMYTCLAGGCPPVLRAMVQASSAAVARYFGWQRRLPNLLGFAAVVVLLIDPNNIYSVGVQLSFLSVATIGVFVVAPVHRPALRAALRELIIASQSRWRNWIDRLLLVTATSARLGFWVWLINVPIVWHQFNILSPVAIPLNILVAPFLLIGLIAGLITGFLGWVPPIGWLMGWITGLNLGLITWMIDLAYRIPFGHLWLPSPPLGWSILFYSVTVLWLLVFRESYRRLLATLLVAWIVVGVLFNVPGPRGMLGWPNDKGDGHLRCTFLDVGHGTSVLIELPDGRLWLYDAGHFGDDVRSCQLIAPSIWNLQATRIDTLVLSHADSDHYNAVLGLLDRFQVSRIASTSRFWSSEEPDLMKLREAIDRRGIERLTWNSTTDLANDSSVHAEVIHPSPDFRAESDNADSLVLQLEHAGVRVLLAGDVEGSGMLALCELPPRDCQVLMAPHHGSLSHDPKELVEWCNPEVVVISGSDRIMQPRVAQNYASAKTLGLTFRDHAVQVTIGPGGLIETHHWNCDRWRPLNR